MNHNEAIYIISYFGGQSPIAAALLISLKLTDTIASVRLVFGDGIITEKMKVQGHDFYFEEVVLWTNYRFDIIFFQAILEVQFYL